MDLPFPCSSDLYAGKNHPRITWSGAWSGEFETPSSAALDIVGQPAASTLLNISPSTALRNTSRDNRRLAVISQPTQPCCNPGYGPSATPTAASSPRSPAAMSRDRNSLCRPAPQPRMPQSQPLPLRHLRARSLEPSKCRPTSPGHPVCAT